MSAEAAAREVLAIIKQRGFSTGDVVQIVHIAKPWLSQGGNSTGLDDALSHCISQGWLADHAGGHRLTEAGAAQ